MAHSDVALGAELARPSSQGQPYSANVRTVAGVVALIALQRPGLKWLAHVVLLALFLQDLPEAAARWLRTRKAGDLFDMVALLTATLLFAMALAKAVSR